MVSTAPKTISKATATTKATTLKDLLQNATRASRGLSALAHEMRLMAICHIGNGEKNVGELVEFLGTTQSNLSQHLAKLRDKDILVARKQGNQVFYSVRDKRMLDVIAALQRLYCS